MTITGTASGRAIGDVAKDATAAMKLMSLPVGYSYQIRGGVQQLNNAFATLGQALVLSVILEYMLLVALYQSWFYPLVLMFSVPLGLVGSLFGLFLTGNTILIDHGYAERRPAVDPNITVKSLDEAADWVLSHAQASVLE